MESLARSFVFLNKDVRNFCRLLFALIIDAVTPPKETRLNLKQCVMPLAVAIYTCR